MPRILPTALPTLLLGALCAALALAPAGAQDRLFAEPAAQHARAAVPEGVQRIADVPYGSHPRQRMDVYLPATPVAAGAPAILMVHGGAWRFGDKAMAAVAQEKAARWVPRGFVFISINYRLHPGADVAQQAADVAAALAAAQAQAPRWGADPRRFILMGHSAGAHLAALVGASPTLAPQAGALPWLGTVALDSAALDVPQLMAARHHRLYDMVMGSDPRLWHAVSPWHALAGPVPPMLLVCSSTRPDHSCRQSEDMARRVRELGGRAQVLPLALGHGEVNAQLGQQGPYTQAVEQFMATLDPLAARLLGH